MLTRISSQGKLEKVIYREKGKAHKKLKVQRLRKGTPEKSCLLTKGKGLTLNTRDNHKRGREKSSCPKGKRGDTRRLC